MNSLYFLFGMMVAAVLIGIILFNPFFGLYVFTILLYLKPNLFGSVFVILHLTRVVGFVTFMVFLFKTRRKGVVRFSQNIQSLLLLMFFGALGLSLITSVWRSNSLETALNFIKVLVAYFLIVNLVDTLKRCRMIIWAMVVSMLFVASFSLYSYYVSGDVYQGRRLFGAFHGTLFGEPNELAMAFVMLLPFLYYDLFRQGAAIRKAAQSGIMGIFLWSFILTQSRGGLLGMSVMLFTLLLRSRRKILFAVIGFFLIAGAWQIAPDAFKERMMTIRTAADEDAAAMSRIDAWKAGVNMMKSRLFGVGVGNFGEGFVRYRSEGAVDVPGMRRAAHNMFVQVGGETGVPGLTVFIIMLVTAFRSLNNVKRKILLEGREGAGDRREIYLLADATFVSFVGYCASGIFLSQGYNFILYYLIAFSVILENFIKSPGAPVPGRPGKSAQGIRGLGEPAISGKWKSRAMSVQLERKR
ncbi:MAG: O-antigen ligase family protein [Candidatus Omnitrophota bacterium]